MLDEHYSQVIAEQLRERGHDVEAVTERADLVGLEDVELFRLLPPAKRALMTENWGDFQRELKDFEATGMAHFGVLFTSAKRMPRGKNTIGLYVRVLDDFLSRHPAEDALLNSYHWLPDQRR
jgi:Domain of unknown function (DUF5615)